MDRSKSTKVVLLIALTLVTLVAWGLLATNRGALADSSSGPPAAAVSPAAKIEARVLADTANGGRASFMILLADQANVSAAYSMKDQDTRGWYVYNTLHDQAERSQAGLRAFLQTQGMPYQPFWIANVIAATGNRAQVEMLAARSDVAKLESNIAQSWIEDPAIANLQPAPDSPDAVEWGVQRVNAPQVWAMGYTGQGIVIGNADTGMRWTHAAIKNQYRGWNGTTADHNYNWWDAIHNSTGNVCGNDSPFPCDDQGHGTHTTGTTVGDDGTGNQIGVAPGAKWIGCRNMDANNGTPARYTECFQFMTAPTDLAGQNPNPTLRADVINNSWECPSSEGCAPSTLETIVNNTQAAGIFVEASAQNSGPGCSSVQNPTAIYAASFSTGAFDINNTLAGFSSRGPSLYYTPNLLKPEISGPGVNVRSSYYTNDTSYASLSGTSMAGPHVVGVVALLWSARPQLARDITTTKQILENTANPAIVVNPAQTCGGIPSSQIPNNSFGYGRVDALAAINSVPLQGTPTPTATPCQAPSTPGPWAVVSPIATPVFGVAAAGDATYAYAAGGYSFQLPGPTNQFARYNPATNTWSALAPLPDNVYSAASVYNPQNNKVYVFGGTDGTNALNTTRIYDVASNTWTTGPAMPAVRQQMGIGYYNGNIYIAGGYDTSNVTPQNTLYIFNGTTWTTGAALPQALGGPGSGVINGHLYIAGGRDGSLDYLTTVYDYNIGSNTWSTVASLPTGVNVPGSAVLGGTLVVFGGGNPFLDHGRPTFGTQVPFTTNITQIYDPVANTWSAGPNLNVARSFIGGAAVGNYLVAIGGYDGSTSVNTTEVSTAGAGACGTTTPLPSNTPTAPPTSTPTMTSVTVATSTPSIPPPPSNTPGGPSPTATALLTNTPTNLPSSTPTVTGTPPTATSTSTPCPIQFTDVLPADPFYSYIRCLACRNIISGYTTTPPCASGQTPCYNGGADVTRGQVAKIVANAAGYNDPIPSTTQTFTDVPYTNPFWVYIERLAEPGRGFISGYSTSPPCTTGVPCFLPFNSVTRGQMAKIDANAGGYFDAIPSTQQTFTDVPYTNPFWVYIERASLHGVISGYSTSPPCPGGTPCFLWANNLTRNQAAKIVAVTFYPNCQTPHR